MSDGVHLHETLSSARTKPAPKSSQVPLVFSYAPSDDGTDENLLIILHGLGDTHMPFAKLGRSLRLPQTAILALRAPERIPYLDEQAFQWYTSFDPLGELITQPNPMSALEVMSRILDHLTTECTWSPHRIHFFGFGQGGSLAAESALVWWRKELARSSTKEGPTISPHHLCSVVSISGPLLSYPTLATPCPTRLLLFFRGFVPKDVSAAFSKGFSHPRQIIKSGAQGEEGMPRSRDEWEPIMQFWSEMLGRRMGDGLYEVMTGAVV